MWSGVAKSLGLRRVDYQSMRCRVFIQASEDTTKNWQCLSDCCPMVHNGSQQNKQTTAYLCQSRIFFGMPERMAWTTAGSNRKVCHYNLVSFSLFSKPPYWTHGWNMVKFHINSCCPKYRGTMRALASQLCQDVELAGSTAENCLDVIDGTIDPGMWAT